MSFPYSGFIEENARLLKENHPDVFKAVDLNNRKMSYTAQNNSNSKLVVFIHGSPGSAEAFAHMMKNVKLVKDFNLIAVDRHGYGIHDSGDVERSLAKQAGQTHELIQKHLSAQGKDPKKMDIIIVGHSYGGAVILQMAADHPKLYKKLIFLASSVDPKLEETKWIQYVADFWLFRWMVPADLDVCNQEILALKESLEKLDSNFPQVNPYISIVHGENDVLVPVANVDYIHQKFSKSKSQGRIKTTVIKNMNHFLPWAYPDLIEQEIYEISKK